MIKVRLYTRQEYMETSRCGKKESHLYVADGADHFLWHILCPTLLDDEEAGRAPFRDAESIQLLKESYDVVFVGDDWYSVLCEGTRMNIACLNKAIQCGLSAIYRSRRGMYTWCPNMCEKVWKVLGELPMDILVAIRTESLEGCYHYLHASDFVVVNYPVGGDFVEVAVKNDVFPRDEFYTEASVGSHLCVGKDGKYYMNTYWFYTSFKYRWDEDIEGIIRYLRNIASPRGSGLRLAEINQTYDVFNICDALKVPEEDLMYLEYPHTLRCVKPDDDSDEEEMRKYQEFVAEMQEADDYKEYLYFRDTFRIVSHVLEVPETTFRKLPMLIVSKNNDGTYRIYDELTVKWPNFADLIREAVELRSKDCESFVLIVDVEEVINRVGGLDNAVCGFKVLADSVEAFDRGTSIRMFANMLEEAYHSGKCCVGRVREEGYVC